MAAHPLTMEGMHMEDQSDVYDILSDPRVKGAIYQAHSRGVNEGLTVGYSEGIRAAKQHMAALPEFRPLPDPFKDVPAPVTRTLDNLYDMDSRVVNLLMRSGVTTIAEALESWERLYDIRGFGAVAYMKLKDGLLRNGHTTPEIPHYLV